MNKRIFVLCLILAVISVSAISAVAAEKVTVSGHDFNVPDGYSEDSRFAINNRVNNYGETVNAKGYVNGNDVISICVMSSRDGNFSSMPNEGNVIERNVNGITGYVNNQVISLYWDGMLTQFAYVNGTDQIRITVSDESLFDEVIIQ